MWASSRLVCFRNFTRKIGLNSVVGKMLASRRYEDRFGPALKAEISTGDTVWDIGANLGLYTSAFMDATGPNGRVVAFEPTAACFAELQKRFANSARVTIKNVALGSENGELIMEVENDPLAATHRVIEGPIVASGSVVAVPVRTAASIVSESPELFPNIVKLDVEGHEGAVMDGFESLLSNRRLRCIGIEIHFGLLEQRGESYRPKKIEKMLIEHNFRVRWTDFSHLLAIREH